MNDNNFDKYKYEMLKKQPSFKELEESYKIFNASGKYMNTDDFYLNFYNHLQNYIADELSVKFYTIDELEKVIPHVDSPYYDRTMVKIKYMEIMAERKYRGEECITELMLLKSRLE